jgi:chromosome segregation ATPase
MIDGMSTDIQDKISLLEEKSAEILNLTELFEQTKAESDRLKTEVRVLTPRNADNQYQISLLEDDLAAKRNTIDGMTAEIQHKNCALDEKITEITYLTEQVELSKDKAEANKQQIKMLEDELANKTYVIEEMSEDIQQKNIQLDRKTAEILDLTELLQQTKAESDGLKKECDALLTINDEKSQQMSLLEQNLATQDCIDRGEGR